MENRFYRLSVNAVGILLICAAILKLHALSLSGLETWLYPSALLVLVTIEFSIGAMLCIGRHGPRLYKASSLLFGAFLAYSVTTMVLGNPNCQCFGVVPHESWHSMLIDLGCLLVVLLGWVGVHRTDKLSVSRRCESMNGIIIGCSAAFVASTFFFFMLLDRFPVIARWRSEALRFSPHMQDIGTIAPGQLMHVNVALVNKWRDPVTVIGGAQKCGCDALSDLPAVIEPGERQSLRIIVAGPRSEGSFEVPIQLFTDLEWQPIVYGRLRGSVRTKESRVPILIFTGASHARN